MLGIPRDEYSSYTNAIVEARLERKSIFEIAKLLDYFATQNMGLSSNMEHDIEIAKKIIEINEHGLLFNSELEALINEQYFDLVELFEKHGYPTIIYLIDKNDIDINNSIEIVKVYKAEIFKNLWDKIIEKAYPCITIKPIGYWKSAFVFCIGYDKKSEYSIPLGMTEILLLKAEIINNGNMQMDIQIRSNLTIIDSKDHLTIAST